MNKYVEALVTQLVRDNEALGKLEFSLVIPEDYKERVYNERAEVKALLTTLGYDVKESGLPEDWANGWELANTRNMDPQGIPADMGIEGKNRTLYKRGVDNYTTYRIWVTKI